MTQDELILCKIRTLKSWSLPIRIQSAQVDFNFDFDLMIHAYMSIDYIDESESVYRKWPTKLDES